MTFAEIDLMTSMEHNRSLKLMEKINKIIDWSEVEAVLLKYYTVGLTVEGADAYPPMMLTKALLLQKWFQIHSDPELENQINDRISFKNFLGLPFNRPSPDHSTFSRFRGRLSQEAMHVINNTVLQQFSQKGLSINEGVAVDARLVQSASHPISNKEIQEQREKRETPGGKIGKNGNNLKFSRDLDSDWVTKNEKHHYGLKEHAAVDTNYGFVLATELTPSSVNDGIMRKDTRSTKLTDYEKERNKQISKKRYIVEQYFGLSHLYNNAFRARFTRLIKNSIDVLFRQMAFNLFRGEKILGTV